MWALIRSYLNRFILLTDELFRSRAVAQGEAVIISVGNLRKLEEDTFEAVQKYTPVLNEAARTAINAKLSSDAITNLIARNPVEWLTKLGNAELIAADGIVVADSAASAGKILNAAIIHTKEVLSIAHRAVELGYKAAMESPHQ